MDIEKYLVKSRKSSSRIHFTEDDYREAVRDAIDEGIIK